MYNLCYYLKKFPTLNSSRILLYNTCNVQYIVDSKKYKLELFNVRKIGTSDKYKHTTDIIYSYTRVNDRELQ